MSGGFVLHGSPHSLYTYKVALMLRSSFRDPMGNDRERRRVYRDMLRPRCCALLKLPFPVQCSRRASVERGGQFYCGQHDPRRPPERITQRKE
jgi:hypothetical protein